MDGELTPAELHELLADGEDVRVVDIRDPASFSRAHVPDSENLPFHKLPDRIDGFDGDDRIVTVCPHGKASVQAARLIGSYEGSADARVESLAGGLEAWADRYELVSGGEVDPSGGAGERSTEGSTDRHRDERDGRRTDRPDAPF